MSGGSAGPLIAGVDSSTQSTKVLLCRAEDCEVVGQGNAPHLPGTECDPRDWWSALLRAGDGLLDRAAAIAVGGQQHGMIVLDGDDQVIRPALLWNDLRSAPQAAGRIVTATGIGGACLLGSSLSTKAGSAQFYILTIGVAGTWAGGALTSGPIPLDMTRRGTPPDAAP